MESVRHSMAPNIEEECRVEQGHGTDPKHASSKHGEEHSRRTYMSNTMYTRSYVIPGEDMGHVSEE